MNAQLNGKSGLSVRFSRIFLLSSLENGEIKVHDLDRRAAYRTESALWASACIRRARSAGLSLICSISNVRSTPNCFAVRFYPLESDFADAQSPAQAPNRSTAAIQSLW